jgi:hypothetical protein
MLRDEPKGWKRLQRKAQRERDPEKLALILDQLNRLLDEHERLAAKRDAPARTKAAEISPSEGFACSHR